MHQLGKLTLGEAAEQVWSAEVDFHIYMVWFEVGRGVMVHVEHADEQQAQIYFDEHPVVVDGVMVPVIVEGGAPILPLGH